MVMAQGMNGNTHNFELVPVTTANQGKGYTIKVAPVNMGKFCP
jgi:hypothetical protein